MHNHTAVKTINAYRRATRIRVALLIICFLIIVSLFFVNITIGSSDISFSDLLKAVFWGKGEDNTTIIVRTIRLPMALMAVVIGACLGTCGCEIQTILRNPIASPYTLGITSAASFGAALGLILNTNVLKVSDAVMITSNAFFFALLASILVYTFSRFRGFSLQTIVLFGMAMNFLFSALTMILQYISNDEDLQSLVFWNMGSLLKSTWDKFFIVAISFFVGFLVLLKYSWKLTAMALNDDKAKSLGVDTEKVRRLVILISSLLTAVAVCFVGAIGFVGIVAPHIARSISGEDQRYFMPLSALTGSIVVSFAFYISKVIIPGVVLPIGLVTSVIGIPFFLIITFRQRRYG